MNEETAIRINDVSKNFLLPHEKVNSVKGLFVNALRQIGQHKTYEVQHALKDVTLEIKKGEFFGIVGRNGSGKSTLLKMIAGIYQPSQGKIEIAGKLVPFIELGVGFSPDLTGRDNVYLNGALLGFSEKEISDQYDDIVAFAELEPFMDQKLKNYSSGMQVRLAFSMAVRAKADILIIDEVLAVGDADFQRKCFDYFRKVKSNNTTVVFVSHDMDAVREYCDRAALIENSEIKKLGNTNDVADAYTELFMNTSSIKPTKFDSSKINERPGSGLARITKAKLDKITLNQNNKEVVCDLTITAQSDLTNLMTGIRIKNSFGQILHETNTWNESIGLPDLEAGKSCKVQWVFPNIYADGNYQIDLYTYTEGNEPADIFDNALAFEIKLPRRSNTLVRPNFKLSIKN